MTTKLPPSMIAAIVVRALRGCTFSFATERDLQDGIEKALTRAREPVIPFVREPVLSIEERPDFVVGSIAVEVKLSKSGGSPANVMRQLSRYLQLESIDGVLLISTSMRMCSAMPNELHGKPLLTYFIGGAF